MFVVYYNIIMYVFMYVLDILYACSCMYIRSILLEVTKQLTCMKCTCCIYCNVFYGQLQSSQCVCEVVMNLLFCTVLLAAYLWVSEFSCLVTSNKSVATLRQDSMRAHAVLSKCCNYYLHGHM